MQYCIVYFTEEKSVELVPKCWIYGDKCFWPPGRGNKTSLIKKGPEPGKDWISFNVQVKGTFKRYEDGRRKLELSQYTSDLESSEDGKKRKIQKPTRYVSDMEDSTGPPIVPCSFQGSQANDCGDLEVWSESSFGKHYFPLYIQKNER
ncbi:unnamed protein product [Ixodes pacificus]